MRLWTLHPRHLDAQGLVALWREGLLAQKALRGLTKGYKHHPQLVRFKETSSPRAAIASYLAAVREEALRHKGKLSATRGQLMVFRPSGVTTLRPNDRQKACSTSSM